MRTTSAPTSAMSDARGSVLPPVPAPVNPPPFAIEGEPRRVPGRGRIASLAVVGAAGVALGVGLGAAAAATVSPATEARDARSPTATSGSFASASGAGGSDRADQVIAAVLAAAPRCTPEIRMAGAPSAERTEFVEEARRLALDASEVHHLRSVRWRVIERGGRIFGVLYGERCD
jgi:hypothetical protein